VTLAMFLGLASGQSGQVHADPIAYVATHNYSTNGSPDLFGQLDLKTGVFTASGDLNTGGIAIFGMGFGSDGMLYGAGSRVGPGTYNSTMFRIDPTTGGTTNLGSLTYETDGLAANSAGTLFALSYIAQNQTSSTLYAINPPSTTSTPIGTVPFAPDGLVAIDSKGDLFATANADGSFYKVSTTDASYSYVGNTGNTGLFEGTFVGNTLYAVSTNQYTGSESIVEINTSNASITQGPNITNVPENFEITAMAALNSVPEPSTILLGFLGSLGVLGFRMSRRRS